MTRPTENIASPIANGMAGRMRSAAPPASTTPTRLPRKNALNTQPYSQMSPRSCSTSGITVATANDSNATSVTMRTMPTVRSRTPGANTELGVVSALVDIARVRGRNGRGPPDQAVATDGPR